MNIKQFEEHYNKLNDAETKKNGSYADEYTWVEHNEGEHKIDFLEKFTQVFKNFALSEVLVDEGIGFIVCNDDMSINEQWLDECLSKGIYGGKAYDKYYDELDLELNK